MAGESRLDLPDLDLVAATLDHLVLSSQEDVVAVFIEANQVARPVDSLVQSGPERIHNKRLLRPFTVPPVPQGNRRSPDVELPFFSGRRYLPAILAECEK